MALLVNLKLLIQKDLGTYLSVAVVAQVLPLADLTCLFFSPPAGLFTCLMSNLDGHMLSHDPRDLFCRSGTRSFISTLCLFLK